MKKGTAATKRALRPKKRKNIRGIKTNLGMNHLIFRVNNKLVAQGIIIRWRIGVRPTLINGIIGIDSL
jgi:hypothetical protein